MDSHVLVEYIEVLLTDFLQSALSNSGESAHHSHYNRDWLILYQTALLKQLPLRE